jgi:acetyl-CoA synthetase
MDADPLLYSLHFRINRKTKKECYNGWLYGATTYTLKNVFNYEENVYWCTADIGWITGHSYILYGPLLNGATTVILKAFHRIQIFTFLGNY